MGKHEIRWRRKMMTSRRIERHKDYARLLDRHHKSQRTKRIIQWIFILFLFLISLLVVYYTIDKDKPKKSEKRQQTSVGSRQMHFNISVGKSKIVNRK